MEDKMRFPASFAVAACVFGLLCMGIVQPVIIHAKSPEMKMTTDIPTSIIVPDKIDTRIGTLEFFDGFPSEATVQRAYDFLDFQRGGRRVS